MVSELRKDEKKVGTDRKEGRKKEQGARKRGASKGGRKRAEWGAKRGDR